MCQRALHAPELIDALIGDHRWRDAQSVEQARLDDVVGAYDADSHSKIAPKILLERQEQFWVPRCELHVTGWPWQRRSHQDRGSEVSSRPTHIPAREEYPLLLHKEAAKGGDQSLPQGPLLDDRAHLGQEVDDCVRRCQKA